MDEAQYLADRVAVISAGRIVAEGDPATLANRELARARIRYRLPEGASPPADLAGGPGADGFTEFSPDDVTASLHRLTGWALDHKISLDGLEVSRPSLEDVYLALTRADDGASKGAPSGDGGAYRGCPRRRSWPILARPGGCLARGYPRGRIE